MALPKEYFGEGLDPEVRAAVEAAIQKLAELGCEIVEVSLPHTEYAIPTYYIDRDGGGFVKFGALRWRALWTSRGGGEDAFGNVSARRAMRDLAPR